jgi:hypothetical protein
LGPPENEIKMCFKNTYSEWRFPVRLNLFINWHFFLVFSLVMITCPAYATNRYVGSCGSCTYTTISDAVSDSVGGDTIYVTGGVYNESVDLNTMATKGDIRLISTDSVTIIPPLPGPGIKYNKADAGDVKFPGMITIDGFHFTSDGGAISLLGTEDDVTISNCIITSNVAGIAYWVQETDGNVTIKNCIANNVTGIGIWATVIGGNVSIEDCTANTCMGIGIWVQSANGNVSITGCNTNHVQGIGTWILSAQGNLTIQNCNFNYNTIGLSLSDLSAGKTNRVMCNNIYSNSESGLETSGEAFAVEATQNWWGDASGPGPAGSGNPITIISSQTIIFDPWLAGSFESASGCRSESIPTLNEWGMIILSMLISATAYWNIKRRKILQRLT